MIRLTDLLGRLVGRAAIVSGQNPLVLKTPLYATADVPEVWLVVDDILG